MVASARAFTRKERIDRVEIMVNVFGVTRIDSAGMGMLVAKLKTTREKQGDMKLVNLTSRAPSPDYSP